MPDEISILDLYYVVEFGGEEEKIEAECEDKRGGGSSRDIFTECYERMANKRDDSVSRRTNYKVFVFRK